MQEMNNEGILTRNNDIKRNAEGYNGPTPYNAIKNTEKMTHTYPRRGWVYDLDDRMALVVSNDDNNRMSNSVSIVFVYPTAIMNPLPTHVDMVCGIARCEKIASYHKDKFGKERFSVSACEMGRIEKAMMTALDIEILPAVPKADDDKKLFAMTLERNMYRSMYESLIDGKMNRKQRRAAARKQPLAMPMSQQKLIAGMYKNGITDKDLKDEFYKGVEAGRRATIKTVYAAAICAAKDILELEKEKLWELIQGVDHHVCNTLSSEEIIDRVLRETGISLNFSDPFETVEITE